MGKHDKKDKKNKHVINKNLVKIIQFIIAIDIGIFVVDIASLVLRLVNKTLTLDSNIAPIYLRHRSQLKFFSVFDELIISGLLLWFFGFKVFKSVPAIVESKGDSLYKIISVIVTVILTLSFITYLIDQIIPRFY